MPDPNSHQRIEMPESEYHMGKLPSTWWLNPWYAVKQIDLDRQRILNREGAATRRINDLEHQVFLLEDVTKMKYPGEYSTIGVGPAAVDRLMNMHEFYTNKISFMTYKVAKPKPKAKKKVKRKSKPKSKNKRK